MKKIFTAFLLCVAFLSFSQKIKLDKGQVLVDEVVWLKYRDCSGTGKSCSLLNLNNEEVIFLKYTSVQDDEEVSARNLTGKVYYVEISFLGTKKKIEIQKSQKKALELLYNSQVVNTDGTLNIEKVDILCEKYGKEFSKRY